MSSADAIVLRSARLTVTIARPGTVYAGARFDWTGIVTQVELDGRHRFCGAEDAGGTGGIGLCGEFGIDRPVGYDEAAVGGRFLKLGIGALTRPDGRGYDFARSYAITPAAIAVSSSESAVAFECAAVDADGYAAQYQRTVEVDDDRLRVLYRVRNVGRTAIRVEQYEHNFLASGAGTHRLAVDGELIGETRWARPDAGALTWPAPTDGAQHVAVPARGSRSWRWRDPTSGRVVSETTSQPWSRFALFVTPRLVCPEAFIAIAIAPGGSMDWSREWRFAVADAAQDFGFTRSA